MSFDLFYMPRKAASGRSRSSGRTLSRGEVQAGRPILPLSAEDVQAVHRVLAGAGARGPDDFGCYVIEVGDGGGAEVFASDLETGGMVALRGLTPHLLRFFFDLLGPAEWVLLPAMEGNPAVVTSPGLASGIRRPTSRRSSAAPPRSWGRSSPAASRRGRRFRDQVVGDGEGAGRQSREGR